MTTRTPAEDIGPLEIINVVPLFRDSRKEPETVSELSYCNVTQADEKVANLVLTRSYEALPLRRAGGRPGHQEKSPVIITDNPR